VNLADAFSIRLPPGVSGDPEVLARFVFSQQAPWIGGLMKVRDALVSGFGLKTAKHFVSLAGKASQSRIGIFKVYSTSETEIVLGEDDKHLDFRVSVLCSGEPASEVGRQLVVSTVVHCHNRLGRAYILLIAPFHRLVVQSSLRRAARIGWPKATDA
jgi:GNAT superfamily N-acetyltransferase